MLFALPAWVNIRALLKLASKRPWFWLSASDVNKNSAATTSAAFLSIQFPLKWFDAGSSHINAAGSSVTQFQRTAQPLPVPWSCDNLEGSPKKLSHKPSLRCDCPAMPIGRDRGEKIGRA